MYTPHITYKRDINGKATGFTLLRNVKNLKSGWFSFPGDKPPDDTSQYDVLTLDYLKELKSKKVRSWFQEQAKSGSFYSEVLSANIENRRYNENNDIQNVQILIDDYDEPVDYKVLDNSIKTGVTLSNLEDIKSEMSKNAKERYALKHSLLYAIETAKTETQLNEVLIP